MIIGMTREKFKQKVFKANQKARRKSHVKVKFAWFPIRASNGRNVYYWWEYVRIVVDYYTVNTDYNFYLEFGDKPAIRKDVGVYRMPD